MSPCRKCGNVLDAATDVEGKKKTPQPGDISICLSCCEVSAFDKNLSLVPVDLDTLDKETRDGILKAKRLAAKVAKLSN